MSDTQTTGLEIAIIGMAGRFPGAADVDAFWANIRDGVETITRFDPADLRARGVPEAMLNADDFVAAGAQVEDFDRFDAGFFGYSPREAEIIDPQQRMFLECAWHALEHAGYAPRGYEGAIGVYASAGMNGYLYNLHSNARVRASVTPYEVFTANDKDFLATRAAFKLNLRGPAVTVQTACSSSLVAVHMAVQSLLAGECDMALAGGVALSRQDGYRALEGSILSPDGHCRAFDAGANGTVTGNGLGLVVLKRLEDALADGDRIAAVIKGTAINNDGGQKSGFTAPSVTAQADVIAAAQAAAGVAPDSIGYIEAHGTGTPLGDPIEVAALTRAFRHGSARTGFCAIGSVKTNIGHLDTAAGIAGLIKTVQMLRHRQLPPTLHFTRPNPEIDFAASPFAVNTALRDWQADGPRRAGVSSFGIGGTNAHVVLEEAPPQPARSVADGPQTLALSARSGPALARQVAALADHLATTPDLRDVAHTLAKGREPFGFRQTVTARTPAEAAARLRALRPVARATAGGTAQAVFLLPGQGSQFAGMGRGLYQALPVVRDALDRCAAHLGAGFLQRLFAPGAEINRTDLAQPAIFAVEYAMAQLWQEMGITPRALIGHSLGELTAACLAGVFDLETALHLVRERGRLMQAAAPGAMVAIAHPDRPVADLLGADLALAAENAPGLSVASGPFAAIAALEARLQGLGLTHRRLQTSHAFHSPAMAEAAEAFAAVVAGVSRKAPVVPMISNLSGTWLTGDEATDPGYWARQMRGTVQFGEGAAALLELDHPVFIEVGPGQTLTGLLRHQGPAACAAGLRDGADEHETVLASAGAAWSAGLPADWTRLSPGPWQRVALPLYPFERERHWVEPDQPSAPAPVETADWVYTPVWQRAPQTSALPRDRNGWLIFSDGPLGAALAAQVERAGDDAYQVLPGDDFAEPGYRSFTATAADMPRLLAALAERGAQPEHILFLWPLTGAGDALQSLIAALSDTPRPLRLMLVTRGAADVTGAEDLTPAQAALHGIAQVAAQEYPWIGGRILDLDPADADHPAAEAEHLHRAALTEAAPMTARRSGRHWRLGYERQVLPAAETVPLLRRNGVFAVIGHAAAGLGRVWVPALAALPGSRLALIEDHRATPLAAEGLMRQTVDCTDPAALGGALDAVVARWGRIDGVFLSTPLSNADVTAPLAMLGDAQRDHAQATVTAPLQALAAAMASRRAGFACVQASLSSVIGGIGLAAYAAAHHHAEALGAVQDRGGGTRWFTIGWDALQGGEPSVRPSHAAAAEAALSPGEAWDWTCRILAAGLTGQTVVSRSDLGARRAKWLNPAPRRDIAAEPGSAHARPDLVTAFVAPRTPIEAEVAAILADLLGLDEIGVEDGFFELGGHSLLAIRAIARLRSAFPVAVEMRDLLFENPSAASIARMIEAKLPDGAELDAMQALLAEVEQLSEADLETALAEGADQ